MKRYKSVVTAISKWRTSGIVAGLLIATITSGSMNLSFAATVDDIRELTGLPRVDSLFTEEYKEFIITNYMKIERYNRTYYLLAPNLENLQAQNEVIEKEKRQLEGDITKQTQALKEKFVQGATFRDVQREKIRLDELQKELRQLKEPMEIPTLEKKFNEYESAYQEVMANTELISSYSNVGIVGDYLPSPTPGGFYLTSLFGYRIHPITFEPHLHSGIDLRAEEGSEIRSVWGGKVRSIYETVTGGLTVEVEHSTGLATRYMHLSEILVKEGQQVKQQHPIGLAGQTGSATASHLHFETLLDGTAINPLYFFGETGAQALELYLTMNEVDNYSELETLINEIRQLRRIQEDTIYLGREDAYFGEAYEPSKESIDIHLKEGHEMPNPSTEIR